jgi:hypothetical protein
MKKDLVKLCVDTYFGRVSTDFSIDQASNAIRDKFVELLGTDKPDYRTFRDNKNQVFTIIEEILDQTLVPVITQSPFFQQFVEFRDLNYGDSAQFYVEDRTMLTVSEVADGHLNLRRQKLDIGDTFTVTTKTYGIKIYGDFLRFVAGRMDWAAFVRKVEEALRYKLAEDIASGFIGASQYLPTQFQKTGSFSDANMSDLIQKVRTANGYAPVVIAGTKNALKKINGAYTAQSFLVSEKMKDEIHQNGILNTYEGIPLMEIPQVFQLNTFEFKLDDNKLFVLPANTKPVKVVREGQTIIVDNPGNGTHMNMDMSQEHTVITKYGVVTIFNVAYGCYTLS